MRENLEKAALSYTLHPTDLLWSDKHMNVQPIKPKLWTPAMLVEHLGVSRKWIYHRTQANGPERIPHLKMGKLLRFDPDSEEFKQWLQSHRQD